MTYRSHSLAILWSIFVSFQLILAREQSVHARSRPVLSEGDPPTRRPGLLAWAVPLPGLGILLWGSFRFCSLTVPDFAGLFTGDGPLPSLCLATGAACVLTVGAYAARHDCRPLLFLRQRRSTILSDWACMAVVFVLLSGCAIVALLLQSAAPMFIAVILIAGAVAAVAAGAVLAGPARTASCLGISMPGATLRIFRRSASDLMGDYRERSAGCGSDRERIRIACEYVGRIAGLALECWLRAFAPWAGLVLAAAACAAVIRRIWPSL